MRHIILQIFSRIGAHIKILEQILIFDFEPLPKVFLSIDFAEILPKVAPNNCLQGHKFWAIQLLGFGLQIKFYVLKFFWNNKNAHISKTAGFRALILCSIDSAGPILGGSPHIHFSPTPSLFELSAIYGLEAKGAPGCLSCLCRPLPPNRRSLITRKGFE